MIEPGHEMAYAILGISFVALLASFFIDKIDFENPNKKSHH